MAVATDMTNLTAEDITDGLFRYFSAYRGYTYHLCNAYVFKWESDFFCIASSGYSYEVEVKVSRSDFFADFENKTERHRCLGWGKDTYVKCRSSLADVEPDMSRFDGMELKNGLFYNGHRGIRPPQTPISYCPHGEVAPNRFLFACPEGMIEPNEVPDYAGLIWVKPDKRYKPEIVKKPPAIHRHRKDFTKILLKKYYWAYLKSTGNVKHGKSFQFPDEQTEETVLMRRTK